MPDISNDTSNISNYTPLDNTGTIDAKSSVIQKNGDVITDTQSSFSSADTSTAIQPGTDYTSDASLPKIPNPSDSRIQVVVAQSQDSNKTDSDNKSASTQNASDPGSASNGEEPSLFVDLQGAAKKGQNSDGGAGQEGQAGAEKGAQGALPGQIQGQVAVGQTAGAFAAQGAQGAQGTTSSGSPTPADLAQFNPDLPNDNPYAQDPLNDFTDAVAVLFGTDYSQPPQGDADAVDQTGAKPLAGDPNSSVLPDGSFIVVDGQEVQVDSTIASQLSTPIIDVNGMLPDDLLVPPDPGIMASLKAAQNDPAAANQAVLNSLGNSVKSMSDILDQAQKLADSLPASEQKNTFLNFLKSVSTNLLEVSNMLYRLQEINTKQARQATQAQKDAAIHDIQEREKAEQKRLKAEAKKRKKAKFGILNKIFSFIKVVFMAIAVAMVQIVPGLGQVAGAYIAAAMVDEVCKTVGIKFSCTQALTKAIANAVVGMMPYLSDAQKEACRQAITAVTAACTIAAMFLSPISFALGGGAAIQATLIDSGIIKNESLRAKFGMALGVAQAVAGVVLAIAMCVIPGGQGAAFGMLTSTLGTTAARVADTLVKVLNVVMATVTVTGQVNEAIIASLNIQIAKIKGAYESSAELIQMLIQLLKHLMQTLQQGIKDFASQISNIQQGLLDKFQGLTASMSALYNAT